MLKGNILAFFEFLKWEIHLKVRRTAGTAGTVWIFLPKKNILVKYVPLDLLMQLWR